MVQAVPPGTIVIPGADTFEAGVVPDPFDERDLIYQPRLSPLPARLDRRDGKYVMLQQGNSCTGHALAAVVNAGLGDVHVSPYMLYYLARRYDEFEGEDDLGSSLRGALKGWYHHGVLPEKRWPGLASTAPDLDDAAVMAESRKIPMGAYYRVMPQHLDDVQSAIAELGSVCVSGMVHEGWAEPAVERLDGKDVHVIRFREGQEALGGHAYALVGYNEIGFLVHNSWGTNWGKGGFATLPYEDWQQSAYDAWVARRGVPGTPLASDARISGAAGGERGTRAPGLDPLVLSKYVVNLGNDGKLFTSGRFAGSPRQIDGIFTNMALQHDRWERQRPGYTTRHIVFYAHGGLTNQSTGLGIANANLGWWLRNGVYPVSFAWQSGPVETLLDHLRDLVGSKIPAGLGFDFAEAADRAVEILARANLTWAWRQMKQNAAGASAAHRETVRWDALESTAPGATLTALRLLDYVKQHPNTRIHLVGHSAGSNFLAGLCARLDSLNLPIESLTYLAPAITVAEFERVVLPIMARNRIHSFSSFSLSDQLERDDVCGGGAATVYRKSILYLVSRAFEGARDGGEVPILGMAKFAGTKLKDGRTLRDAIVAAKGCMVESRAFTPFNGRCDAVSHVDFDTNMATMTSVLLRILGMPESSGPENFYERSLPVQ